MTGGLTWIGFVEAKALADNGIRVAISARRGGDTAMYADMRSVLGEDTAMRPLNVRDERSVDEFFVNQCGTRQEVLISWSMQQGYVCIKQRQATVFLKGKTFWKSILQVHFDAPCLPAQYDRR